MKLLYSNILPFGIDEKQETVNERFMGEEFAMYNPM